MNIKEMFGRVDQNHIFSKDDLKRGLELSKIREYPDYLLAAFLKHYQEGIKVNGTALLAGIAAIAFFRDSPVVYPLSGGIIGAVKFLKNELEGAANCIQVANERGLKLKNGLLFPSIILSDSDPRSFF